MSLDSPLFLSAFLPLLVLLYCLARRQTARILLLLFSGLLFYAASGLGGLLILLLSAAVNYGIGCLLSAKNDRKVLLYAGIAGNLALLGYFKYLTFLMGDVLRLTVPVFSAAAPLGISFFTFKCISYLAEIHRSPDAGAKRFEDFLLYVSFFPEIAAGPISRFPEFNRQLEQLSPTMADMALGMHRFIRGLAKKLLLAFPLAEIADPVFGSSTLSAATAWLGAAAYMLQIYFDFSAYSDMALGLGRMFGLTGPENFNSPYLADSVSDFWRRWHISLSAWFRDYLYIPLGGSRKGTARAAWNKLIVFTLCGLWHGASWTFLLWGIWHGVFCALETLSVIPVKKLSAKYPILSHGYTLLVVCFGFVLFRAQSVGQSVQFFLAMLGMGTASTHTAVLLQSLLGLRTAALFAVSIALCLPARKRLTAEGSVLLDFLSLLLLILCLAAMAANGFRPFIYAQF